MIKVFVSSSIIDLIQEREKVRDALLSMNCMPIVMENFSATDLPTLDYIKNIIADCNCFIIILGGRYGSICEENSKSYTQLEYEFAQEIGLPIFRFIHKNPNILPYEKQDSDFSTIKKFNKFRELLTNNTVVKFWSDPYELALSVVISMHFYLIDLINNANLQIEIYENNKATNLDKESYDDLYLEILSETTNIAISRGIVAVSDFLNGIKIEISPSNLYYENASAWLPINLFSSSNYLTLAKFEGRVNGYILFSLKKECLDKILTNLENKYSININQNTLLIDSLIQELSTIFIGNCLSMLSNILDASILDISSIYFNSNSIVENLNCNHLLIYGMECKKESLIKIDAFLLLDENSIKYIAECTLGAYI